MANEPTPVAPLEIVKWHHDLIEGGIKDAREQVQQQMKLYLVVFAFAFAVAGGLITFAGWLGYKNGVDEAVRVIKTTLSEDIKAKIVDNTADEPKRRLQDEVVSRAQKDVAARIEAMIASADRRYVKLDGAYAVRNGSTGLYLDVFNAAKDQSLPVRVQAIDTPNQKWTFIP